MGHVAILIDKKLYFSDVSQPFNIETLTWNDLTYTGAPTKFYASACNGASNNDLFIFGGTPFGGTSNSFAVKYDINDQHWTEITSGENEPKGIDYTSCAKFNNRSIAIFGGRLLNNFTNDLWIFDLLDLKWSLNNAPHPFPYIWSCCAITLPDESILYIGGISLNKNGTEHLWELNTNTSGPTPHHRYGFSAVLTSDKRIIIFGGYSSTDFGDLWILDITTYQWSEGIITNPNGLRLSSHTETFVDNYMIIAFGGNNVTNFSLATYMLDVNKRDSYTWVTDFIPSTTNTTNFK
ncbi:hypothetical protein C2G38_2295025 [Gigaspora rosea]|uniref:Galactose oxidase n=1 Tax=Gigaspora rosea TaxID=44941 RepID=A0A397VJ94_9GLOM|nr:hypothetical protein C2G38_2295025 [Gigaspora rosea]